MRLATFALIAVVVAARAGLTSVWRTEAISVDGLSSEWQNLEPLDRGPVVGAANDGEFLYLVVSAKDPESIAHLSTGLIVWLDPAGRRGETFGLRLEGVERPLLPGMTPTAPPTASTASPASVSATVLDRFDVLGPGRNQRRLVDLTPELGIEIASSRAENEVAYELKIPLQKTSSRNYAVGVVPGRTMGFGIATPEAPVGRGQRPRLVGDSGYIGGDPWFGGGFAKYREDDGKRKPLGIWTTLTLATRN